ncbi:FG-GAP repeat domain-containing protein [Streptomyces sp. NPDC051366]|uniref:FG-GAP repeat domain-containing protein n=1 Tax=Streptomyces sp. NPDC051366 TaxID=3365652 RepID=UPI0037B0CFEB
MQRARLLPMLSAAALALALGLSAASPASAAGDDPAAPRATAPRTSPTPGFAGEDRFSDCDTDPYSGAGAGWVGLTDVTVRVTTASPSAAQLKTTFQLWDTAYSGSRTDFPTSWAPLGEARTDIPRDRLVDGGQYAWRARSSDGTLTGPYTAWCYFRVDHTQPTAEVTTDATPKKVGKEATFTLHGSDASNGSGIACARWRTTGTPSVGWRCSDEATDTHIVRLTEGAVDIKLKPATWGSQAVYLETMDNAGNVSQSARVDYYAQPAIAPASFGDIDADGKPDVLVPDAAGNLRKLGSDPRGTANARRFAAPGDSGSWAGVQYTHRGTLTYSRVDDLLAHAPGGSGLDLFRNDGAGLFTEQGPIGLDKPDTCRNTAGEVIDCTQHGFGSYWTQVTQIAAYGSTRGDTAVDGILPDTSLLSIENGRLWLTQLGGSGLAWETTLISPNDDRWAGYELLTPGAAQGTEFPTLWARSRADGTIRAFSVAGTADAPDFSAFADPAAGPALATMPVAGHPQIGSDGDLTGDGLPDLWSAASGKVTIFPGVGTTSPHPTVTGFAPAA